jgi:hypothetical protein
MVWDWVVTNKEWFLSGLGIFLITIFRDAVFSMIKFIWSKIFSSDQKEFTSSSGTSPISINNNISLPLGPQGTNDMEKVKNVDVEVDMQKVKGSTHILFIDDQIFPVYKTLKSSGWTHTTLIKDIKSLDDQEILNNDIFFIDIRGVGKKLFNDEGLGIAKALKNKYPHKKVIIYSAETMGNRFDEAFRIADDFLQKNADYYDFLEIVEKFGKEIYLKKESNFK